MYTRKKSKGVMVLPHNEDELSTPLTLNLTDTLNGYHI